MDQRDLEEAMLRERLFLLAKKKYPGVDLAPCGSRESLWDSFEWYGDTLMLYFNVGIDTHAVANTQEDH
jgi:hypothetical protein